MQADFHFLPEEGAYRCPQGQHLRRCGEPRLQDGSRKQRSAASASSLLHLSAERSLPGAKIPLPRGLAS